MDGFLSSTTLAVSALLLVYSSIVVGGTRSFLIKMIFNKNDLITPNYYTTVYVMVIIL